MANGNGTVAPSAIHGDSFAQPMYGGVPLGIAIPYLMSSPAYSDLPPYWTPYRDVVLAHSTHKENMWAGAVARFASKFASHGWTIKDSEDSKRRVGASQDLLLDADGGQGWIQFAVPCATDLVTTDSGVFIRIRRANDELYSVRTDRYLNPYDPNQAFDEVRVTKSSPGAKIIGLYHLDSLRCMRTGDLEFPVRYQPLMGTPQLFRWDQVLTYADQRSARVDLCGVGQCAASRCYETISTLAALRQMIHEFIAGKGATKLAFLQGIRDTTLKSVIKAGEMDAQAKGFVYYLGTILGAIDSDTPLSLIEVILKQLPTGIDFKQFIDDCYLIYANNLGLAVSELQPLSGQGLGTGTQSVILQEQTAGAGALPTFLKWWEQTFSRRVLPATTELSFDDENDLRDQEQRAKVKLLRAQERSARIQSGEITPAIARQLAADDKDLPDELLAADATEGGQLSDDEKPATERVNPAALDLMQGLSSAPPALPGAAPVAKSYDALYQAELTIARSLAKWSEV